MTSQMRIGDTAQLLSVTTATIRNWLKLGNEFFSENATRKTGKRFNPSDIDQLKRIQKHLKDGLLFDQIPAQLQPAPQIVTEVLEDQSETEQQQNVNALQPVELFEYFKAQLDYKDKMHQENIKTKDETIKAKDETIKTKDETIKTKDETIERLTKELERKNLPWWKRLRN